MNMLIPAGVLAAIIFLLGAKMGVLFDDHRAQAAVLGCNQRVEKIAEAHNKEVAAAVRDALISVKRLSPTPETAPELAALCEKSASCRNRGKL